MSTVRKLQDTMHGYKDVAVTMQVKDAVSGLIKDGQITSDDQLSLDVLEKIRQRIYVNSENPDPMSLFFGALVGQTGNPVEAALQYIERLQREKRP